MTYYMDEASTTLSALKKRLQGADLIPSQEPLLEDISGKMSALGKAGVISAADLRAALKTTKALEALSQKSGVDTDYLQLLRRAVNGFFPKPRALDELDWLDTRAVASLKKAGIRNTRQLFDAGSKSAARLAKETGISQKTLLDFILIADLCRIQWVSPTFARVLVAAGFTTPAAIAEADPETLYEAIAQANAGAKYYKGKVGLRDVKRLVGAAAYAP